MKWVLVLSVIIVSFLGRSFTPSYLAADPGPKVVVELIVTPDEISIGDIVELIVRVTHPVKSVINVEPTFHHDLQPLSLPKINVGYQNTNQISTEFIWSLQFLSIASNESQSVKILLIDDDGQTEELVAEFIKYAKSFSKVNIESVGYDNFVFKLMYASKKYLNMMEKYQANKYLETRKRGQLFKQNSIILKSILKK